MSSKTLVSHGANAFSGKNIKIPGDKSLSHRALILASQTTGKVRVTGLLEGDDVLATKRALQLLGVPIDHKGNEYLVTGVGVDGLREPTDVLHLDNAGTGVRLLMGLVATQAMTCFFTGDDSLRARPMRRVLGPLSEMGMQYYARQDDYLPLVCIGAKQPMPISYTMPVASAQVKSAILLAGLSTPGVTTVIEPVITRDHTERMLTYLGAEVNVSAEGEGCRVSIAGFPELKAKDIAIPADPSSAAFVIIAAMMIEGSKVVIPNVLMNPGRIGLFTTLKEMGASFIQTNPRNVGGEPVADIEVRASDQLRTVEIPASRIPSMIDEIPILAMLCASIKGVSVFKGVEELRVKESNRLKAIIDGLKACGVNAYEDGDDLYIEGTGKVAGGAKIQSHMDHRIAMSFLVLGAISTKPITVSDAHMIQTSFPGFVQLMSELGLCLQDG